MKKIYIFTFFLFLFVTVAGAQGQTDSLMNTAKDFAKQGKYEKAEKIYSDLLQQNPDNNDLCFALALVYSWSKKHDKARSTYSRVLAALPESKEVYIASLNNELWDQKFDAVLTLAETASRIFPSDNDIMLIKVKALTGLERGKEAILLLDSILINDKANVELNSLRESIIFKNKKNNIAVNYSFDNFNNNNPWHWANIQYKRKTNIASFVGRLNYANRMGLSGYQLELDAYPSLTKKSYAYANIGFSAGTLFPVFRIGFDYYKNLPHAFEASVGIRYLDFKTTNVSIFTGHIGKYLGNYWFSFRPYLAPGKDNISVSGILISRLYFSRAENFVDLQLGYGTSPDDRSKLLSTQNDLRLVAYKARIGYHHIFSNTWTINLGGGYAYEEYNTSLFRSKITLEISLSYLF